jgi:hypothetical protein
MAKNGSVRIRELGEADFYIAADLLINGVVAGNSHHLQDPTKVLVQNRGRK